MQRNLYPKSRSGSWIGFILFLCAVRILASESLGQRTEPLQLVQKIPLPEIEGRIDHMALDLSRDRLLVAALASHRLELVDLEAHKVIHSILGLNEPQGVVYIPGLDRLFVADGGDGNVNAYDGKSFAKVGSIAFDDDADNLRYDPSAKIVYVGYGAGAIGAIDVTSLQRKGNVKLRGHPESFQLEQVGTKLYVNVPAAKEIAVIDRSTMSVITNWPLNQLNANFPMSLDEKGQRLFIGTRQPARVLVQDITSGRPIVELTIAGDTDDLFYDARRRQLYVSCGEGVLEVFREEAQNHFRELSQIPTVHGARTCLMDSQGGRLFLAVPRSNKGPAAIWIYRINPMK
jgi:hypothetical protein